MVSAEKEPRNTVADNRNSILVAPAILTLLTITVFMFSSSASATELNFIEEINSTQGQPLNISANLEMENNTIQNVSDLKINSGFKIENYTFVEQGTQAPALEYDTTGTNDWKFYSEINANEYNISSLANIESFFGACSGDNVVTGMNDDGSVNCVDPEKQNVVENLSQTLEAGNVANQTIDMDDNKLGSVGKIKFNKDAALEDNSYGTLTIETYGAGDDDLLRVRDTNAGKTVFRLGEEETGSFLRNPSSGNDIIRWNQSGGSNVEIPNGYLDIGDGSGTEQLFLNTDGSSQAELNFQETGTTEIKAYYDASNDRVIFNNPDGSDLLRINEGGPVEVPTGDLDLANDLRNSGDTVVYDNSNGELLATPSGTSATNPVLTRSGDDDTGIGFSGSDELVLITGNTEGPTVDSSQNFDLGGADLEQVSDIETTDSIDVDIDSDNSNTGNSFEISRNGENTDLVRVNEDGKVEILQDNLSMNDNYIVDVQQINLTSGTTIDGSFDIENSNITMNENYLLNATGISTDRLYAPGSASEVDMQDDLEMNGYEIESNDGSEFTIADLSQIDDGFTVQGDVSLSDNNLTSVDGLNSDGSTTNIDLKDNGNVLIDNGDLLLSYNNITNPDRVDNVNLDRPGNAIEVSSNGRYRVITGSLTDSEISDNSLTNSSIDSSTDFTVNNMEVTNNLQGTDIVNTVNLNTGSVDSDAISDDSVSADDMNSDSITSSNEALASSVAGNELAENSGVLDVDEGAGSGLNADQLDGLERDDFARNRRTFEINSGSGTEYYRIGNISSGGTFEQGKFEAKMQFAADNGNDAISQVRLFGSVRTSNSDFQTLRINQQVPEPISLVVTRRSGTGTSGYDEYFLYAKATDFSQSKLIVEHNPAFGGFNFQSGLSSGDLRGSIIYNTEGKADAYYNLGTLNATNGVTSGADIDANSNNLDEVNGIYSDDSSTSFFSGGATDTETVSGINENGNLQTTSLSLTSSEIEAGAVGSSEIENDSVSASDMASDAINSTNNALDSSVAGNELSLSSGSLDVDEGSGSGLNADQLDGQEGSHYEQDLEDVLENGTSAGDDDIDMNNQNVKNVNKISGNSAPVEVANDVDMTGSSPEIDMGSGMTVQRTGGNLVISD